MTVRRAKGGARSCACATGLPPCGEEATLQPEAEAMAGEEALAVQALRELANDIEAGRVSLVRRPSP